MLTRTEAWWLVGIVAAWTFFGYWLSEDVLPWIRRRKMERRSK